MGDGTESFEEVEETTEDAQFEEPAVELEDEDYTQEMLRETPEQTAERVAKALKEEPATTENQPAGSASAQGAGPARGPDGKFLPRQPATQEAGQQQPVTADEPPQRFTPQARAEWANTPPAVKQELARAINDVEQGQRKWLREQHAVKQQAETVVNAVSPWAKDWAEAGISVHQGVALLARTHENIVKDPDRTIAQLITDNSANLENIKAYLEGRAVGNAQPLPDPGQVSLQKKYEQLNNEFSEYKRAQAGQQAANQFRAFASQRDSAGNPVYPDMLKQEFLDWAHPHVIRLRTPTYDARGNQIPGMSIEEAYKRAYAEWQREHPSQNNLHVTQPQTTQRPSSTPVSMRPRSAPLGGPISIDDFDPKQFRHETPEQTAQRVANEMARRGA